VSGSGALWRSTDGRSWEQTGSLPAADPSRTTVTDVTYGHGQFVVTGFAETVATRSIVLAQAVMPPGAVWISDDGLTWTTTSPGAKVLITALVADDSGYVGLAEKIDSPTRIARSGDGTRWVLEQPEVSGGFEPHDIAVLESGGLIAVGVVYGDPCGFSPAATIWLSDDGSSWAPTGQAVGCGQILELAQGARGYIARGYIDNQAGVSEPRVWHSPDGRTWGAGVAVPFGPHAIGVASDGTFIGLGEGIWESEDGREWVLSAETGGRIVRAYGEGVAIGCADVACVAWLLRS
jgi:hypothetical protein